MFDKNVQLCISVYSVNYNRYKAINILNILDGMSQETI